MFTAADTEGALITNRAPIPVPASVAFSDHRDVLLYAAHDPVVPVLLEGVLSDGVILANASFDLFMWWKAWPQLGPSILDALEAGRVRDVLSREKYIDIASGVGTKGRLYNLGSVAERRCNLVVDKTDPWRKRYGALIGVPIAQWPAGAVHYARLDPWATYQVYVQQELARQRYQAETGRDVFADQEHRARTAMFLYAMTLQGMCTDPRAVELLDQILRTKIAWLERQCLVHDLARFKGVRAQRRVDGTRPGSAERHAVIVELHSGQVSPVARFKAAAQAALQAMPGVRVTMTKPSKKFPSGQVSLGKNALDEAGIPRGRWGKADRGEVPTVLYDKAAAPKVGTATVIAQPLECYRALGGTKAGWTKNIPVLRHPLIRTRYNELVDTGRASASGFKPKKGEADVEDLDEDDDDYDAAAMAIEVDESDPWIGTNTQNWDRDGGFRECIVPPPPDEWSGPDGYAFAISDFGALELVAFAQVCIELGLSSAMAEILRAGRCPHRTFAASLLSIPYDAWDKSIPEHKDARQIGKVYNFGKLGAMGALKFIAWAWSSYDVVLTVERERELTRLWHRMLPEVDMFWNAVRRMVTGRDHFGPLHTVVIPRSGRIRAGLRFPDACNTHFQGLGSDVAMSAGWSLFRAQLDPASPLYRCPQVLMAHDEFVTVVPRRIAKTALAEQERIMIASSNRWCPDVPMKVESHIVDRYQKI